MVPKAVTCFVSSLRNSTRENVVIRSGLVATLFLSDTIYMHFNNSKNKLFTLSNSRVYFFCIKFNL